MAAQRVKLQNYMKQELEHQSKCSICWQVGIVELLMAVDGLVKLQNYMKQELEHQSKYSICWQVH